MRAWIDLLESRVLLSSASSQDQLFAGDFDGDGDQDLLDARQGSIWVMEDGVRVEAVQPPEFTAINPLVRGVADVNGDGTDDVVTYKDGAVNAWIMSGARPGRQQLVGASFGWRPAAFGDVNGDGTDDIIWQNHLDGTIRRQLDWRASSLIGMADLQQWQLIEATDLNGDGREDLLWATYPQFGSFMVGAWLMEDGGAAEYRHIGLAGADWRILGAEDWREGAARILWSGPAGEIGAWSISPDAVTYEHLGTTGITYDSPTSVVAGVADIDGNGRQDILFEARAQQAFGAWLMSDTGAHYQQVASGVSSFHRYITTPAAGDPYVVSQSTAPVSVARNSRFSFDTVLADPATGRISTGTQAAYARAEPGRFRVEGGPERISYDPSRAPAVLILSVSGLEDRYEGGEDMKLQVRAHNSEYNPNAKLTVTFSTNNVLGDSDDVAAPAQDFTVDYGVYLEQVVTLRPPVLQGSYYVIVSASGDETGTWVSPQPVEIMSNPPLTLTLNYERGTYVGTEPVIIDVTITNESTLTLPAGVPVTIGTDSYTLDNKFHQVPIAFDRQVYDQGLASGESRTFRLQTSADGFHSTWARWPGGEVSELDLAVSQVSPQDRFLERADLDGDGDDDLVYRYAEAWILEGGERVSTEPSDIDRPLIGIGDLNGDGADEVLILGASGPQALRLGDASPVEGVVPGDLPSDRRAMAVGDVDGDGIDDILWSSSADSIIRASIRNSDGSFIWRELGAYSAKGWSLAGLADLDGDGDDDLLWGRYEGITWAGIAGAWIVGDSGTTWLELPTSRVPHYGDFNADGRTDLLSKQNGVFEVRLMNADLTTSSHTIERGEDGWRLVAVADVNSDGTDDLVWRSPDHWTVKAELMRDGVGYDWQTVFEP